MILAYPFKYHVMEDQDIYFSQACGIIEIK